MFCKGFPYPRCWEIYLYSRFQIWFVCAIDIRDCLISADVNIITKFRCLFHVFIMDTTHKYTVEILEWIQHECGCLHLHVGCQLYVPFTLIYIIVCIDYVTKYGSNVALSAFSHWPYPIAFVTHLEIGFKTHFCFWLYDIINTIPNTRSVWMSH